MFDITARDKSIFKDGQVLLAKIKYVLVLAEPMVAVLSIATVCNIANVMLVILVKHVRQLFAISTVIMADVFSVIITQRHVFALMDTLEPIVKSQISP